MVGGVEFYGISTILGYLMLNSVYCTCKSNIYMICDFLTDPREYVGLSFKKTFLTDQREYVGLSFKKPF